ncbi:uncharacterized protein [Diadema setosum]|uniref:uncharacterized protein n=1 Tax=Diadema setosum TaxID=31175 RepID=UPI003B3BDAA7
MARIRNIAVPFLLVTIIASFFTGVYSCARGCRCVGSNKFRAVCSMSYRFSHDPPVFVERTITSLETHRLMFEDLEPYFHALGDRLKEVIIFPGSYHYWEDKIRERLFHGLNRVEKLFIRGTRDQRTPVGLEAALKVDLPALKSIELRGNTLLCDCTLPDILAERRIFVTEKSGIYPIKNCDEDYYSRRTFSFENFQKECARKGGYTLPDFSNTEFKNYKEKVKWGTHIKTPEEHGYNRRKIPKSYWEDRKKKEEEIRRRLATVPAKISREQRQKEFKQRHTHHMWKHLRKRRSVGADTPEELGVDEQPVNSERNGPIAAEQGSTTDIEGMVQPPVDPQSNTVLEVIDAQDAPDEIQDLDLPESFLGGDNVQNLDHDLVPTDNGPENSRPHGEHHSSNREHTKGAGYGAAQLAFLQLPMNDLTIRLNPYDPFEVDLFFKYVLHKNYPV